MPNAATPGPEILPLGQDGVLVRFSRVPSASAAGAVLAFAADLRGSLPDGAVEAVPSLTSVLLRFDPGAVSRATVAAEMERRAGSRDWLAAPLPPPARRWTVPAVFGGEAGPQLAEFAALSGKSEARLVGFMEPAGDWPRRLTIDENLIDLGWHQREFTLRHSFAYTVMNDDESRCLGCCYIYPSNRPEFDAMAFYWAREAEFRTGFDDRLGELFRGFIAVEWPFKTVAFPGRDIAWSDW